MSKLKEYRISELGEIGRGRSRHRPRNDKVLYGGEYPFIQTGDVKRANFFITEHTATYNEVGLAQSKMWEEDTLCITIAANIADTAILKYPACFPDSIIGFQSYKDKSDVRFIKYYFDIYKKHMESISMGATQNNLSVAKLESLTFKVPSIKVQKQIANVLSTYDKLIENNNRRIEVLEQTAEEIYKEWFVRMRFPGYENTKFDKGIPEGWELKKVDDIISFDIGGGWGKDSPEEDFTERAHVIRGTDIPSMKYGEINHDLLRFHKESQLRNRRLQTSDIIFEASGGSKDQRLGRTYYITDETLSMYDHDVICASFCKVIRIDEKYLSWYFNNYLNYAYTTETLSIFEVQSTGISNFGFTKFKKHHQVLLPPADLMKRFFELTYNMYIDAQRLGRKNQNLKKQRDLLLPRLMNGTIEVK
ncbi:MULTISPECIES: restriction endonuclease subunit S [Clostridia]|uniref:restriction endonuclease subunit S n=1 Tax=Clostridia TaxID=186801 RepID=UPI000EA0E401|nr:MULTISPECIES: restriction endonuclease subunit S [Clostridia]NBJ71626.1 restriction endonuclease subunit S [Roseburia sp. 1XD42-34]RKI74049.1 restriction endonuclease subunit S [Clostridium sp. 1xD42-85]